MAGLKQRAKTLIELADAALFYCRERPIPIGPSIMTRFGSNANAASPTAILERRLARVALAGIQDSIPRPAGAPLERFAAGVELAAFFPPAQPNDDGFDPF